jgi:hypothetical protein
LAAKSKLLARQAKRWLRYSCIARRFATPTAPCPVPSAPSHAGIDRVLRLTGRTIGVRNPSTSFEWSRQRVQFGANGRVETIIGNRSDLHVAAVPASRLNVVFRADGRVDQRLVMRGEEAGFEFVEAGRTYAFDADGGLLRLASEAYRIRLAYLFDPYIAVTASQIEALPHQITAVYGEMLPRQPLRFLLADDPGAGKTIMAGLLASGPNCVTCTISANPDVSRPRRRLPGLIFSNKVTTALVVVLLLRTIRDPVVFVKCLRGHRG